MSKIKEWDGEKYGYICMTCGKTISMGVNNDGECPSCVISAEIARAKWLDDSSSPFFVDDSAQVEA